MILRQPFNPTSYSLHACLPFVELASKTIVHLGPVVFWPASKADEFLEKNDHSALHTYLQSIGQIKARMSEKSTKLVNTGKLSLDATTCISISNSIPSDLREFALVDALYLLYFACTFRNLYFRQETPSFDPFRKLIPCSVEFINNPKQWESLYIDDAYREDGVCINLVDEEICRGLGKALGYVYLPRDPESGAKENDPGYQRLIRSIRYFVDCYFQRFINLFNKGLDFPDQLCEAEDIVYLSSGFEALFDIQEKEPAADFKQKLRSLLHLKHSTPLEFFWKWVDDFYEVKKRIVRGDNVVEPMFRHNPNFEVSHLFLGTKLFIYSVYYSLFQLKLIESTHEDPYIPPDFKWIHPEEILVFFWSEEALLRKLSLSIKQAQADLLKSESLADVYFMTHLFVLIYERYYHDPNQKDVRFIPADLPLIVESGKNVLELLHQEQLQNVNGALLRAVHQQFIPSLMKRLGLKT